MFVIFQVTFKNVMVMRKLMFGDSRGKENPVNQGPHCLICILRTGTFFCLNKQQ
jgi:hypothetical protein